MISNDKIHIPAEPLVECPACGLPAEITNRFTLGGAPGPVEHVKVVCVLRHWFTLPVDMQKGDHESSVGTGRARRLRDIPHTGTGSSV